MRILLVLCILCTKVYADVSWDIPVNKFGTVTGKLYLFDLMVGDTAKIDEYSSFCTTDDGKLAVHGITEIGSGDYLAKLLPGKKVELTVPDTEKFVKKMIANETYALCSWWTADKGKSSIVVDSINGNKSLSGLLKKL